MHSCPQHQQGFRIVSIQASIIYQWRKTRMPAQSAEQKTGTGALKSRETTPPGSHAHILLPHNHSWHPEKYTGSARCSGRYFCVLCKEYLPGENCFRR